MTKNIIICCDGTGNEYGDNNTNVVHSFEHIVRNQSQVAFYDPGVGTFNFLGIPLGRKIGKILGKAFGLGLRENIEDAYEYLMNRYEPGDQVFVFGFSRGAYTARALAGMLCKLGILQKGSKNLIPYATDIYLKKATPKVVQGFGETYCHPCKPHFVGVWDTVGSFGWFSSNIFKNFVLDPKVQNAFHAISIDERRSKFPVTPWDQSKKTPGQIIEQVWFAGVHSDVGGFYTKAGLSDIALEWMLMNAAKKGLKLKNGWQKKLGPNPAGKIHESYKGWWLLLGQTPRVIPNKAKIHNSVFLRMKKIEAYNPRIPKDKTIVK